MDTEFALAGVEVAEEEVEVVELSTEDEEDEDVADQVEEDQETKQEGDEAGQDEEEELGQAEAAEAAEAAACNDAPAGSPRPAAAQRATPPPRSPPAEQAGHSTAPADSDPEDGINIEEVEVVEVCEEDAEDAAQGEDEDEVDGDEDRVMGQAGAAEAAVRQAEAEGLTLQPSDNATGYRGVYKDGSRRKPFYSTVWRAGKSVNLGCFATAEEHLLAAAQHPCLERFGPTPVLEHVAIARCIVVRRLQRQPLGLRLAHGRRGCA